MDTLTSLFISKRKYLARIAFDVLHDSDDVDDIIQDAFCKLWEKREQLRFTEELKCLMARTVYRLSLDCLSRRQYRERFARQSQMGMADMLPDTSYPDLFTRALEMVNNDRTKRIMVLLYQKGYKPREAAEELGLTQHVVRMVNYEAMKVLRKKLKGVYE